MYRTAAEKNENSKKYLVVSFFVTTCRSFSRPHFVLMERSKYISLSCYLLELSKSYKARYFATQIKLSLATQQQAFQSLERELRISSPNDWYQVFFASFFSNC